MNPSRHLAAVVAAVLLGLAGPAVAADGSMPGNALVIGEGLYAGRSTLPSCSQSARAVSARLHRLGYAVDEAVDMPASGVREALGSFAGRVAASPGAPALAYVCAEASTVDQRLFLLPSDVDLQQPLQAETQGVVVRALLNALGHGDATLVAEFALHAGNPGPVAASVRDALPPGMRLALVIGDGRQTGVLGGRLADDAAPLDRGWFGLATALQARPDRSGSSVATYAPTPLPPPPPPAALPPPPAPAVPEAPPPSHRTQPAGHARRPGWDRQNRPPPHASREAVHEEPLPARIVNLVKSW